MPFSGQTIIITGAGKGIGRATAELLTQRGARIVALSRTQSDLDTLSRDTGARGIAVDLSDPLAARRAIVQAGACDALVNCAGTNVLESVFVLTEGGYDRVMDINLRAALVCSSEFAAKRRSAGGGGTIVNITSIAGHRGFNDHLCYAASKAGLEAATRVMARELGPEGIRVLAVAPTVTMTELAAEAWSDPVKSQPMLDRHPIGRFAEATDVAQAIAIALSKDASMMTGSVLAVDGGFLAV